MSCASLVPCQNPQIHARFGALRARTTPWTSWRGSGAHTHLYKTLSCISRGRRRGGSEASHSTDGSKRIQIDGSKRFWIKRSKFGFFFNGFLCVCSERARRGGAPPGALKSPTLNQSDGALRHARAAVRPRGRRGHHQRAAARCGARTPTNSGAPRCCLPGRTLCQPSTGRRLCSYNTTFHKAPPQRPSGGV